MAQPVKRRPFQGVWTIIRFNWHFHTIALAAIAVLWVAAVALSGLAALVCALFAVSAAFTVMMSLIATWHAYDASGLYQLGWLAPELDHARRAGNIHAGFDETSILLKHEFRDITWHVFDFYHPAKHTEISIRRARRAQAPSPETIAIQTDHIPLADASLDRALLILAAHEIRDHDERVSFFRELKRVLAPGGRVIVTEHLRDFANIAAFSVGAWHFHPREEWLATFHAAGFRVAREFRNNLLITTFVLEPDADTP
jgi:SAM-dependent methyltransferase